MSNQFLSPNGDLENYFITEYWLIDQYVGDQLFTWGNNASGQLGNNTTTNRSTAVVTSLGGTNWKQVSAGLQSGGSHTVAVKTDGTLWTWGLNSTGQLGNNATTNRSTPVTTFAGGTNWKQVSAGGFHTAAIKTDGTLWTWGNGVNGVLGTNNTINRSTPVTIFSGGANWRQVSSGTFHTTAVKTDGTLWVWGNGDSGRLGTNDTINRSTPVTTFSGGTNWKQVSAGGNHTIAVKTDGTLWTWGNGTVGQLGTNNLINRSTPVTTFAGGIDWKLVSAGYSHTVAIKESNTLWTWGNGDSGRLGTNDTINRSTPVTTFSGGTNWKQIGSGFNHTVAVKTDGTLWVWGNGVDGKLGTNDTINRLSPVIELTQGDNWKQITAGGLQTAGVQSGINLTD